MGMVREEGVPVGQGSGLLEGAKLLPGLGPLALGWGVEGKVCPSWKRRWGTAQASTLSQARAKTGALLLQWPEDALCLALPSQLSLSFEVHD